MNYAILTLFAFLGSCCLANGQEAAKDCGCPENQYAGSEAAAAYTFSEGGKIALCGYRISEEPQVVFSEFILAVCATEQIIDFWDAMTSCRVYMEQDTLQVQTLYSLPLGADFALEETAFLIEKISLQDDEVNRSKAVNRQLKRYNQTQISEVLASYQRLKREPSDAAMAVLSRLFVATLSGSDDARQKLLHFRNDFHILDGAYSEEYHQLVAMLKQWDELP